MQAAIACLTIAIQGKSNPTNPRACGSAATGPENQILIRKTEIRSAQILLLGIASSRQETPQEVLTAVHIAME
jgi:hypothetical protein